MNSLCLTFCSSTAIVVRFLTGRYLSEYASSEEVTYERSVTVDDKQVSIKITDVSGKVKVIRTAKKMVLSQVPTHLIEKN